MSVPAPMATAITRVPRELLDDDAALREAIAHTTRVAITNLLGADHDPISVQVMQLVADAQVIILADFAPPVTAYGVLATLPRQGRVLLSRFAPVAGASAVDLVVKVRR
ncbi:MAG: hypothetical protein H7Y15_02630 [Pseudonocardia sp.]|nr:hypothetical protein [Pseudonocardia sp.]